MYGSAAAKSSTPVVFQVFFSMVLLIQAPDLLTMNGTYFYFMGLLDGGGETLFILHVTRKKEF